MLVFNSCSGFDSLFRGFYLEGCGFPCFRRFVTLKLVKLRELQPVSVISAVSFRPFVAVPNTSRLVSAKSRRFLGLCQTLLSGGAGDKQSPDVRPDSGCVDVNVVFSTWRTATVQQFRGIVLTLRRLHPECEKNWCHLCYFILFSGLLLPLKSCNFLSKTRQNGLRHPAPRIDLHLSKHVCVGACACIGGVYKCTYISTCSFYGSSSIVNVMEGVKLHFNG